MLCVRFCNGINVYLADVSYIPTPLVGTHYVSLTYYEAISYDLSLLLLGFIKPTALFSWFKGQHGRILVMSAV